MALHRRMRLVAVLLARFHYDDMNAAQLPYSQMWWICYKSAPRPCCGASAIGRLAPFRGGRLSFSAVSSMSGAGTLSQPWSCAKRPSFSLEVRLISQGETIRPSVSGESQMAVTGSMNAVAANSMARTRCSRKIRNDIAHANAAGLALLGVPAGRDPSQQPKQRLGLRDHRHRGEQDRQQDIKRNRLQNVQGAAKCGAARDPPSSRSCPSALARTAAPRSGQQDLRRRGADKTFIPRRACGLGDRVSRKQQPSRAMSDRPMRRSAGAVGWSSADLTHPSSSGAGGCPASSGGRGSHGRRWLGGNSS